MKKINIHWRSFAAGIISGSIATLGLGAIAKHIKKKRGKKPAKNTQEMVVFRKSHQRDFLKERLPLTATLFEQYVVQPQISTKNNS